MSFTLLKDSTVTVAPLSSRNDAGDPTYGAQQTIDVRFNQGADVTRDSDGAVVDQIDKITTDEYEFSETDAIWLPGTNAADASEAVTPIAVGTSTIGHITISTAEV